MLMPDQDSRDTKGRSPRTLVMLPEGWFRSRSYGQANGKRWDRKAQSPLPDATGIKQTGRKTKGFGRRIGEPWRDPWHRYADCSHAANPRRSAARDRVRHGSCDRPTAQRELEGTLREHPAPPTTLVSWHKPGPFPAR